jgi:hypothetical protein
LPTPQPDSTLCASGVNVAKKTTLHSFYFREASTLLWSKNILSYPGRRLLGDVRGCWREKERGER